MINVEFVDFDFIIVECIACYKIATSAKMFSAKILHQKIKIIIVFRASSLRYNLLMYDSELVQTVQF